MGDHTIRHIRAVTDGGSCGTQHHFHVDIHYATARTTRPSGRGRRRFQWKGKHTPVPMSTHTHIRLTRSLCRSNPKHTPKSCTQETKPPGHCSSLGTTRIPLAVGQLPPPPPPPHTRSTRDEQAIRNTALRAKRISYAKESTSHESLHAAWVCATPRESTPLCTEHMVRRGAFLRYSRRTVNICSQGEGQSTGRGHPRGQEDVVQYRDRPSAQKTGRQVIGWYQYDRVRPTVLSVPQDTGCLPSPRRLILKPGNPAYHTRERTQACSFPTGGYWSLGKCGGTLM